MRRLLRVLLALCLGAACAGLLACGGSSKPNPHLLTAKRADRLNNELDAVSNAVDSEDCGAARSAAARLLHEVETLPDRLDQRLADQLKTGAEHLAAQARKDCQTPTTTTETIPTTTQTVPTTTTTTTPTTTDTTPTTTQTTPTTPTTTTPTTTTTTPGGGATAPSSGQGAEVPGGNGGGNGQGQGGAGAAQAHGHAGGGQ